MGLFFQQFKSIPFASGCRGFSLELCSHSVCSPPTWYAVFLCFQDCVLCLVFSGLVTLCHAAYNLFYFVDLFLSSLTPFLLLLSVALSIWWVFKISVLIVFSYKIPIWFLCVSYVSLFSSMFREGVLIDCWHVFTISSLESGFPGVGIISLLALAGCLSPCELGIFWCSTCPVILDWILDILNSMSWDSGLCLNPVEKLIL